MPSLKVALITTTINVPEVLALYRAHDPDVRFFVAGDLKTPKAAVDFCNILTNTRYISPDDQKRWGCSELIGWNCIQRRNIALLEALEWGADIVVTIDDDNIPIGLGYFAYIEACLTIPFCGPCAIGHNYWFDIGELLVPKAKHRGFPHDVKPLWSVKGVANAPVGVVAGLCLGDPDIDATTRIALAPEVHSMSELARSGIVVDQTTWTVFNSQNTAFRRDLAPYMFMFPGTGRYDDIYASLVTQWAMHHRGYFVHFGPPAVWQSRNPHNLLRDLRQEIDGMEKIKLAMSTLRDLKLAGSDPWLDMVFSALRKCGVLSDKTVEAAFAWGSDIQKVM